MPGDKISCCVVEICTHLLTHTGVRKTYQISAFSYRTSFESPQFSLQSTFQHLDLQLSETEAVHSTAVASYLVNSALELFVDHPKLKVPSWASVDVTWPRKDAVSNPPWSVVRNPGLVKRYIFSKIVALVNKVYVRASFAHVCTC